MKRSIRRRSLTEPPRMILNLEASYFAEPQLRTSPKTRIRYTETSGGSTGISIRLACGLKVGVNRQRRERLLRKR